MARWDTIDSLELPIVKLVQSICFARRANYIHRAIGMLFTEVALSLAPLVSYSFYGTTATRRMSASISVLLVFTSVLSRIASRACPGRYASVVQFSGAPLSSFPGARLGCLWIIVYFMVPRYYRLVILCLGIANQVILGFHFVSDCVCGVFLAQLSVYLAKNISNMNLVIILLLFAVFCWRASAPIVGAIIPVLFAEPVSSSAAIMLFIVVVYGAMVIVAKDWIWPAPGEYELMVSCMLASASTLYLVNIVFGHHRTLRSFINRLKDQLIDGI